MVFLGYGIVVSGTGRVYLTNEGDTRVVDGPFGSVDEAKAAVEAAMWGAEGEGSSCPVCDAFGCGGDGGGCYRFEGRGEVSDPRNFDGAF